MDLEPIKQILIKWAQSNSYINKVYIYGSRARSDYRDDSDLDIALEIIPSENDSHPHAVFAFDSKEWVAELQPKIPYQLHLKGSYGEESPDVTSGIKKSSILVYEKTT